MRRMELLLGQVIRPADAAERDAVHIAIVPKVAGEKLKPGQRVGVSKVSGDALGGLPYLGVVDPYLDAPVEKGEVFWLCLRPGMVTGLRHVYDCPALDGVDDAVQPELLNRLERLVESHNGDGSQTDAWRETKKDRTKAKKARKLIKQTEKLAKKAKKKARKAKKKEKVLT